MGLGVGEATQNTFLSGPWALTVGSASQATPSRLPSAIEISTSEVLTKQVTAVFPPV